MSGNVDEEKEGEGEGKERKKKEGWNQNWPERTRLQTDGEQGYGKGGKAVARVSRPLSILPLLPAADVGLVRFKARHAPKKYCIRRAGRVVGSGEWAVGKMAAS